GETALMTAARTGQLDVMQQLIAHGADVNAHENKFEQTALMWATGYPDEVKLLIAHGADVHAHSKVWVGTTTMYSRVKNLPWGEAGKKRGGTKGGVVGREGGGD